MSKLMSAPMSVSRLLDYEYYDPATKTHFQQALYYSLHLIFLMFALPFISARTEWGPRSQSAHA
jgi:hypothetical protein